jgi:hypothetical protein
MLINTNAILRSIDAAACAKDLDGNYTCVNATVERIFSANLAGIIDKGDCRFSKI